MLAAVVAYFVALVGATGTFAVLNARDEQRKRDAEHAEEAAEPRRPTSETRRPTTTAGTSHRALRRRSGAARSSSVSSPADGSLVFEPER